MVILNVSPTLTVANSHYCGLRHAENVCDSLLGNSIGEHSSYFKDLFPGQFVAWNLLAFVLSVFKDLISHVRGLISQEQVLWIYAGPVVTFMQYMHASNGRHTDLKTESVCGNVSCPIPKVSISGFRPSTNPKPTGFGNCNLAPKAICRFLSHWVGL